MVKPTLVALEHYLILTSSQSSDRFFSRCLVFAILRIREHVCVCVCGWDERGALILQGARRVRLMLASWEFRKTITSGACVCMHLATSFSAR